MEFFDDRSTRYALVKKGGSSTLGRALRPGAEGGYPIKRFVVFIRHPKARLISGWADLVRDKGHKFCGVKPSEWGDLYRFSKMLVKQNDEEMDHHYSSQVYNIQQTMDKTEMQPCGQLFIGLLEDLDEKLWPKLEAFKGKSVRVRRERISQHEAWQTYYDPNKQKGRMLDALVKKRWAADLALWHRINDMGGWFEHQWGLDWQQVWADLLNPAPCKAFSL